MNRVDIDKEYLIKLLNKGYSYNKIAKLLNIGYGTVKNLCVKYEIDTLNRCKNKERFIINKIDSKELAYLIGIILTDGYYNKNHKMCINVKLEDKEILDFIASIIDAKVTIFNDTIKNKHIFPRARLTRRIDGLDTYIKSGCKEERNVPILNKNLENYMLLGIFDGDGCITWGVRKDRNRIWHKFNITSSYNIVLGVQNILNKYNISSSIRPKKNCNCYVLEICNKKDILKIYDLLYVNNFVI